MQVMGLYTVVELEYNQRTRLAAIKVDGEDEAKAVCWLKVC